MNESCISENCPFLSLRHTSHAQINHAVTSAVKTISVLILANNNHFKAQAFIKDYPVNQKWNKFRLSKVIRRSTLSHSTHFRTTCNFNTDGLVTTDYLRAKTTDLNILQLNSYSWPCVRMEYINIRDYHCYDCRAKMS